MTPPRRGRRAFFVPLLCLAFSSLPAFADPPALPEGLKRVTAVEGITEYRLGNGLQILLIPDVSQPKVTVNLTVFVGCRHEGYGETGMAHLLEHMVFKGSPKFPDVPKALRDHGAELQRHHLARPHQLLRDDAGDRREPRVRHRAGSRPHGEQLRQAGGPRQRVHAWSATSSSRARTARERIL